jgi:hypothetical protein
VRRNQLPDKKRAIPILLFCLAVSVTPLHAQGSADQVWSQLQVQFTTAQKSGFKQFNYIFGWLDDGGSPAANWPLTLFAGRRFMIVGVCDNDCTDVDLELEDKDRVVLASDTAADDLPTIHFTPSETTTYWVKPIMHECTANPCGYGIAVFIE